MLKRDVPKSIQKEDGASYGLNFMTGIVNELTVSAQRHRQRGKQNP